MKSMSEGSTVSIRGARITIDWVIPVITVI